MRSLVLLAVLALAPGCIATTHMSPDPGPRRFNEIAWRSSFDAAKAESLAQNKPLLTVIAAGARNGFC